MVVGFFLTFFTSHRRVMVKLSETEGRVQIGIAGTSNKNPVGLDRELEQVAQHLRDKLKQRGNQDE
jgi:cytochrome c biogenesis protein ResB